MATPIPNQTTTEEKLIWFGLILTYPCYLIGGLYILGSVLGWLILATLLLRIFIEGKSEGMCIPAILWVWILAMLTMLVALLVAHIDRELGIGKTIKSSIGWAKGWALLALFPLLGAMLPFRLDMLIRGCCMIGMHSLVFAIISIVVFVTGLSGDLFISPLKIVGGPGNEFFTVRFFGLNPETGLPRWNFFGPWAPSAGLLSCIYLVICAREKNQFWRSLGILGAAAMCLLCQSRAGWALFAMLIPVLLLSNRLTHPGLLIATGIFFVVVLLLGQPVISWLFDSYQQIKDSRPDSTRVRSALAEIALQRWQAEAPIWGHGVVERGPKMVEYMPIGTHHSWYGLLFVKGWVGALSLAVPLGITLVYLGIDALKNTLASTALILVLVLVSYSFFENLEILVYLFWPALLWLGAALNPLKREELSYE